MRTGLFLFLILSSLYADSSQSCMEKLHALEQLREEKISVVERVAVALISGTVYVGDPKGRELDEKIRVLELELQKCK